MQPLAGVSRNEEALESNHQWLAEGQRFPPVHFALQAPRGSSIYQVFLGRGEVLMEAGGEARHGVSWLRQQHIPSHRFGCWTGTRDCPSCVCLTQQRSSRAGLSP